LASASRPAKPVHKSNAFKIPHLASGVPGLSSPGARLHRARTLQVKLHPGVCTHASPYRLRPSWSPMWLPPAWSRHSPWWACEHPVTHSVRLCAYKKQLVLGKAAIGGIEPELPTCQTGQPQPGLGERTYRPCGTSAMPPASATGQAVEHQSLGEPTWSHEQGFFQSVERVTCLTCMSNHACLPHYAACTRASSLHAK